MHSVNVNQAIRMILVKLCPFISAEDVAIYVCIYFLEKFLLFFL